MNIFIIQVPESKFSISHAEMAYKYVKNFKKANKIFVKSNQVIFAQMDLQHLFS